VAYVRQLLAALAAVHEAGVVHRDVKPGNVMVCPAGRVGRIKLFDFGVAKVEGDARRFVAPLVFPTREGLCLGTPRYISPEQVMGVDVDRRTDIYAAGMLLYTLIAGRGPFDDIVGVEALLEAHFAKEAPPPSRFMPAPLAPPVEAAILRAIAKKPTERFADATAFSRELRQACGHLRASQRLGRSRRIAAAAPYDQRRPIHRCRIRAITPSPPRAVYGGTRTLEMGTDGRKAQASRASEDDLTVAWSGTFASRSDAPPPSSRRRRAPVSRRGVFCSAAAFFAVALELAMWFVR
jgi:serine/threonine protein kinase